MVKNNLQRVITFVLVLFMAGCARLSPDRMGLPESARVEAARVRQAFAEELPGSFILVSTVVFKYSFLTFSALGVTRINEPDKEFDVTAMTPVGVKLFEMSVKNGSLTSSFAMPELAKRGDISRAVSENIERIYFSRVPPEGTQAFRRGKFMVFSVPSGDGVTEYFFGKEKEDTVLLHKRYLSAGKRVWDVSYSGYFRDKQGKVHPKNIVFIHYAYSYRLLLRVKELRS
jgi:hypothetical protein